MINFSENLVRNVPRRFWRLNNLVARHELKSITFQGKRYYYVPHEDAIDGFIQYASVTTIIAEHADKTWYPKWVARVGQDEADRITAIAARRGKAIHDMAESFFMGNEYWSNQTSINIMDFNKIVPILNQHIDFVYGIELPLYSHKLKTAGTADLACRWDNYTSIVDFKTARKARDFEQIENYFIQASCYAMMFEERYNIPTDKIVIIMLVDHESEPEVYVENVYPKWSKKVEEYFT